MEVSNCQSVAGFRPACKVRNQIIADGGSVQGIAGIPADVKEVFRTVWEIKQRSLLDMAADRGAFIDQVGCEKYLCVCVFACVCV